MTRHRATGRQGGTALGIVLLVATATACSEGDKDKEKATGAAAASCDGVLRSDSSAALPADYPALDGQQLYDSSTQGKTKVVFGHVKGGPADLSKVRDQLVAKMKSAGYTIEGTDQEQNAEAEAEFTGPHEGTVNVRPLCKGNLVVRYKFNS